ncbi:SDR family NAD(P)-dependent oxidoreductase [Streptomyces sp. NPDC058247]|uniref:SDR family NAD(P)-dependent oxidoreductase n=1 Tax=Streptomyces sp. NPDC058247 TaxID=3346401 RepID=UPI0036E70651
MRGTEMDLAGKVAVVTGAASGIGRALAGALRAAGAEVVPADRDEQALAKAAGELEAQGVVVDVSRYADVRRLGDAVMERHGRVDLVVNNAGIARIAPFEELALTDLEQMLGVNLWGVVHGMKVFLPLLERSGGDGFLVNTASIAGARGGPGLSGYSVTKFGVVTLTETVAQELARSGSRVGVGVLLPARVRTAMTGHAGAGIPGVLEADDVAEIALEAIRRRDLYIVTHPEALDSVRERHRRIEAAFEAAVARSGD